jgi:hypothetical protein
MLTETECCRSFLLKRATKHDAMVVHHLAKAAVPLAQPQRWVTSPEGAQHSRLAGQPRPLRGLAMTQAFVSWQATAGHLDPEHRHC